jgi:hypothetical protein
VMNIRGTGGGKIWRGHLGGSGGDEEKINMVADWLSWSAGAKNESSVAKKIFKKAHLLKKD